MNDYFFKQCMPNTYHQRALSPCYSPRALLHAVVDRSEIDERARNYQRTANRHNYGGHRRNYSVERYRLEAARQEQEKARMDEWLRREVEKIHNDLTMKSSMRQQKMAENMERMDNEIRDYEVKMTRDAEFRQLEYDSEMKEMRESVDRDQENHQRHLDDKRKSYKEKDTYLTEKEHDIRRQHENRQIALAEDIRRIDAETKRLRKETKEFYEIRQKEMDQQLEILKQMCKYQEMNLKIELNWDIRLTYLKSTSYRLVEPMNRLVQVESELNHKTTVNLITFYSKVKNLKNEVEYIQRFMRREAGNLGHMYLETKKDFVKSLITPLENIAKMCEQMMHIFNQTKELNCVDERAIGMIHQLESHYKGILEAYRYIPSLTQLKRMYHNGGAPANRKEEINEDGQIYFIEEFCGLETTQL